MSRYYEMKIEIEGHDESKENEIQQACFTEWSFEKDDWFCFERHSDDVHCMEAVTQGHLCGGEGEDEFADRISEAIWKANNAFCPITVNALNMEAIPYEAYTKDEDDYAKIMEVNNE